MDKLKKAETVATYDTSAPKMAEHYEHVGARIADIKKIFSYLPKENPSILEIGCGNGRDALEITRHTRNYIGVDISQGMLEVARKTAPDATFIHADIETWDFPQGIDGIVAFASLLHLNKEAVRNVLERACNALNEGGIFYISVKRDNYKELTKTDHFGTRTYYFYTADDIAEVAHDLYEVVEVEEQTKNDTDWLNIVLRKK